MKRKKNILSISIEDQQTKALSIHIEPVYNVFHIQ